MSKAKGLGRGLDALLGADEAPKDALTTLAVGQIRPGRYQPRTRMDRAALAELSASIKSQGLMQPLLVRPVDGGRYELIAGERRWRAAQMAGLNEVPALVRAVPDESALAMSLIENIQREDLNPMEEAAGLQRLIDEFSMTHEQAADAVGRSRSATTNLLRLLKLPKPVQAMVMDGALEMGHARALLSLDAARQIEAANRIAARGLSVRRAAPPPPPPPPRRWRYGRVKRGRASSSCITRASTISTACCVNSPDESDRLSLRRTEV
jgi:ParB family chromosome partitioning protein